MGWAPALRLPERGAVLQRRYAGGYHGFRRQWDSRHVSLFFFSAPLLPFLPCCLVLDFLASPFSLFCFPYEEKKKKNQLRPTWVNWETKAWAEAGGIVGRGVLIDYASWADSQNISVEPFETVSITTATLDAIASSQGTTFRSGDILFIRSGWTRAYNGLDAAQRAAAAKVMPPRAIGLESSIVTLKWLWEREFAAIAGDHPSMEAWPCQNPGAQIHQWLLAGWGMPIGELFDLEELSRACARRQRWSFFFSSVPLKVRVRLQPPAGHLTRSLDSRVGQVPGGVASPPNGVAIF